MQKELWGWKKWIYFRDAAAVADLLLPGLTDAEGRTFLVFFFFRVRRRLGGGGPTFKGKRRRSSLFAERHKNPEKSRAPKRKEEIRDEGRKGEVLIAG